VHNKSIDGVPGIQRAQPLGQPDQVRHGGLVAAGQAEQDGFSPAQLAGLEQVAAQRAQAAHGPAEAVLFARVKAGDPDDQGVPAHRSQRRVGTAQVPDPAQVAARQRDRIPPPGQQAAAGI
jgi:hypothetical protein